MKRILVPVFVLGLVFGLSALAGALMSNNDAYAATQDLLVGKVTVTDGDTVRMGEHRIRLFGIDAVEARQTCQLPSGEWACGRASRRALERLVEGRTLTCEVHDMDRGRHVAVCYEGTVDINARMVRRGWAVAYTQFSEDYVEEEAAAQRDGLALWRSEFERPHDYRARLRAEQANAQVPQEPPSADCAIKGNISRDGTKIFHEPGQRFYEQTRINEDDGERWFCSPAQARSEGWRRAVR